MNFLLRLKICFAAIKHAWHCCDEIKVVARKKLPAIAVAVSADIDVTVRTYYYP